MLRLCDRGRGGVRIRFGEGLARVPDGVDAVYCYLMPRPMERVRNELAPRLKTGARIVSYLFPVRAWEPERVVEVGELHEPLYLYRMPPRPAAVPPPTVAAAAVAPPSAERHVDEGPSRLPDIVPGSPALPPAAPPEGGTTNGDVGLR
ncbi:MAG: hypothetical protein HYZ53_23210 [Planctomycetes bacterium]|nr:hypothetical protein [Planctomycetota bacterium]